MALGRPVDPDVHVPSWRWQRQLGEEGFIRVVTDWRSWARPSVAGHKPSGSWGRRCRAGPWEATGPGRHPSAHRSRTTKTMPASVNNKGAPVTGLGSFWRLSWMATRTLRARAHSRSWRSRWPMGWWRRRAPRSRDSAGRRPARPRRAGPFCMLPMAQRDATAPHGRLGCAVSGFGRLSP